MTATPTAVKRYYILQSVSHLKDEVRTAAQGGGGIVTLCGIDLRWYAVGERPRGIECFACHQVAVGADELTPDEFPLSVDEALNLIFGLANPDAAMQDELRPQMVAYRQARCRHEGRTYDAEDAAGQAILVCAQCEVVLMTADEASER